MTSNIREKGKAMSAVSTSVTEAKGIIEAVHPSLERAVAAAIGKLTESGMDDSAAMAKVTALLVGEVSRVLAATADQGRASDARTFEAMLDVNAASSHFQSALDQGVRHAADEIKKDGYTSASALVLAASRALDAVADILKAG